MRGIRYGHIYVHVHAYVRVYFATLIQNNFERLNNCKVFEDNIQLLKFNFCQKNLRILSRVAVIVNTRQVSARIIPKMTFEKVAGPASPTTLRWKCEVYTTYYLYLPLSAKRS